MNAALLAIGDELVSGRTTDTNSGFLAQALRAAGAEITGFFTVADDEDAILEALRRALADADLVVTTGGLGPTSDDLTTACVAALAGAPLDLDESSLKAIEERFRSRGLEMPPNNRKQAHFPRGSTVLPNPDGTAPGFIRQVERQEGRGYVACLPGVPREMRRIAEESLLPWVAERSGGRYLASRVFSTVGLSESRLDELLEGAIATHEGRVSYRAAFPRLQVRLSLAAASPEEGDRRLDALEARVRDRLGDSLYAVGDVGLEETVGELLRTAGLRLAVAESCTGGLIGHRITEVAGSSAYFVGGVIAYSNDLKERLLGVSPDTLATFGAVSEPTVKEMARGARSRTGAELGLATSGIAGPGGGSAEKPVGTVCIGLSWPEGEWSRTYTFGARSRSWIKEVTAQTALDRLRRWMLETEPGTRRPGPGRGTASSDRATS